MNNPTHSGATYHRSAVLLGLTCFALFAVLIIYGVSGSSSNPSIEKKSSSSNRIQAQEQYPKMMAGGLTPEERAPTDEVVSIAEQVRPALESKLNRSLGGHYKALGYKSQVVAGTNYFIKVDIGDAHDCVLLRVYNHFSGSIELAAYKMIPKNAPIEYF